MTYRPEMAMFWALYAVVSLMIFATAWIMTDDLKRRLADRAWRLGRGYGAVFLESVGLWRWGVKEIRRMQREHYRVVIEFSRSRYSL